MIDSAQNVENLDTIQFGYYDCTVYVCTKMESDITIDMMVL